jgi:hypothetical protein
MAQRAPEPFAVVVADLQMPGLSGIGLLQCIRQLAPQTVRVLLSGNADLRSAVDAVNTGEIYRFITKPYEPEHLIAMITEACEHHQTLVASAAGIDHATALSGYVTTLNRMLEALRPDARETASRIERRVREIVDCCPVIIADDLCAAAALSQIGAVSLPADAADRIYGGAILSPIDVSRADSIAIASAEMMASTPALACVREILYATTARVPAALEAFAPDNGDAAGASDGAKLSGRILAAAMLADQCARQGMVNPAPAFEATALAQDVRERVREILARDDEDARIRTIPIGEVRAGMTLATDVIAPNGLLFAGRGQRVTPTLVTRLREGWDGALLSQPVRVFTYGGVAAAAVVGHPGAITSTAGPQN